MATREVKAYDVQDWAQSGVKSIVNHRNSEYSKDVETWLKNESEYRLSRSGKFPFFRKYVEPTVEEAHRFLSRSNWQQLVHPIYKHNSARYRGYQWRAYAEGAYEKLTALLALCELYPGAAYVRVTDEEAEILEYWRKYE